MRHLTISTLLPLALAGAGLSRPGICSIEPEGGGQGGGGGQPPVPPAPVVPPSGAVPPVAPPPPVPPPAVPQGVPQPVVPPTPPVVTPPVAPPPAALPADRPVTMKDLEDMSNRLIERISGRAPQTPPAAVPPVAAPPVPPTPPAVDPLHAAAAQTRIADLEKAQSAQQADILRLQNEKRQAEEKTAFTLLQDDLRLKLVNHDKYKLTEIGARKATEELFSRKQVRRDDSGQLFIALPKPEGGEGVYPLAEGLTKYLESQDGMYHRQALPGGTGAAGSNVGYPPSAHIPIGAGGQGAPMNPATGFAQAMHEQEKATGHRPV